MKIDKSHIGKKIKGQNFGKGFYFIPLAQTSKSIWIGEDRNGNVASYDDSFDWELYTEPVWWEEGKVYYRKGDRETQFSFFKKCGDWYVRWTHPDSVTTMLISYNNYKKEDFEEVKEKKKEIIGAPALVKRSYDPYRWLTSRWYEDKDTLLNEVGADTEIIWPAPGFKVEEREV